MQYLAECLSRVFSLVKLYFPSYSVRLTGVKFELTRNPVIKMIMRLQNTISKDSTIAKVFDIVQISLNC